MLPIILSCGLFLPVAAYFYYMDVRHILNRRTARKDLPGAAKELGLKRKGGGDLGTYEGRIDGYFVRITADEYTKITVMLKSPVNAWMTRTNLPDKLINGRNFMAGQFPEHIEIMFGNRDINRFFHYRYGRKEVADALGRADGSLLLLGELAVRWRRTMGQMQIARDSVTASPSRGTEKKCHSITGGQLKEYLPHLVALARMWDELPELREARALSKK